MRRVVRQGFVRRYFRQVFAGALTIVACLAPACSKSDTYLDNPSGALPQAMSELGVYDGANVHPSLEGYTPAFPLWSSGSDKERFVLLPDSSRVGTNDDGSWLFPDGTLLFKTFAWQGRRIETRVLLLSNDGSNESSWEYAVYQWEGDDAFLVDLSVPHVVELEDGGEVFEYQIPSRRQCRTCHEAGDSVVLGFSALQLDASAPYPERIPATDEDINHPDALTHDVLGYLEGNCTHCHNGRTEFDLRYDVALDTMIGQRTASSGAEPGIRVIPGNPDESLLLRFLRGSTSTDMPPLGVQRRDNDAVELVERWIAELEE